MNKSKNLEEKRPQKKISNLKNNRPSKRTKNNKNLQPDSLKTIKEAFSAQNKSIYNVDFNLPDNPFAEQYFYESNFKDNIIFFESIFTDKIGTYINIIDDKFINENIEI